MQNPDSAPRYRLDAKRALAQPPPHKDKYLVEQCFPACEQTKERCHFHCARNRARAAEGTQ